MATDRPRSMAPRRLVLRVTLDHERIRQLDGLVARIKADLPHENITRARVMKAALDEFIALPDGPCAEKST